MNMENIETIDRVLLIDDQAIIGEAVRRMIASQGAVEIRRRRSRSPSSSSPR
jgi:chemotaxis response regulator CheB